ncbi:MAG: hypothetical protein IT179_02365 [Acidobacteria bacterium]|nr:hypothetical protein [Acidobacteriota bacterium]
MKHRVVLVAAILATHAGWAHAQSLADVARAEQSRRKTQQQPAKVYTNDDLKPDFSQPAAPAAGSTAATGTTATTGKPAAEGAASAAPAAPATPQRDQAYWFGRITEARSQLERSRTFATALQNRIDALMTDFINRDNPVERSGIEQERIKALAELDRVRKDIEAQTKAIADIEDEARRAGVPPGWLRS